MAGRQPTGINLGKCINFNQTTSAVTFAVPSVLAPVNLTTFTIAAWAFPRTAGGGNFGRIFDTTTCGFGLNVGTGDSAGWEAGVKHSTTNCLIESAASQLTLNQWQQVLATFSDANSAPTLYVNGQQITPITTVNKSGSRSDVSGGTGYIGNGAALTRAFDGLLDEVCVWNRILTSDEILSFSNGATPSSGLVLHYKMDESSGNLVDASGNGITGTPSNVTQNTQSYTTSSRTAATPRTLIRPGYLFNGRNQYIEVADNDAFSIPTTGELTVSMWIRFDDLNPPVTTTDATWGEYTHFLGKSQYAAPNQCEWEFRLYNKNSGLPTQLDLYLFNLAGGIGADAKINDTLVAGEWIHLVGKVDATNSYIYKNGVLRDTRNYVSFGITPANGTSNLRFGHTEDGSDPSFFKGALADVRIFNRALSSAEILSLYHGASIASGLVGLWTLDGNINDSSGNGRNGTNVNGTVSETALRTLAS